jgi:hypothetical protein
MIKFSASLRDYLANNFGTFWSSGNMEIYSGEPPLNPEDSVTGVLLATVTLPSPAFDPSVTGVLTKAGTWSGPVTTSGIAGCFKLNAVDYDPTIIITGTCGEAADNPDAVLDSKTLIEGGTVVVSVFGYTQPQ